MRSVRRETTVVVMIAFLLNTLPKVEHLLFAADPPKLTAQKPVVTSATSELSGKVMYSDAKTPASKVPVRVWSVTEKKFVVQTTTDENGNYTIPKLQPGRYVGVFGDRVRVDIQIVSAKEPMMKFLNVIIPRGAPTVTVEQLAAELATEGAIGGGGSTILLTAVVITVAGGALAVAIIAAAGGFGGERRAPVSP